MKLEEYRYIVVEGPIGVGKTSLARRVANHLDSELLLEKPAENPFLEKFYGDIRRYALPTQLFFLFQRVNQLQGLAQIDMFTQTTVGDFLLDKDPLFARLTLSDAEYDLYRKIYQHLQPKAVGVIIRCRHMCMESRGIAVAGEETVTSAMLGDLKTNAAQRAEFMALAEPHE